MNIVLFPLFCILTVFPYFQDDEFTHLYTLVVNPDNTYVVKIDNQRVEGGSLDDDWDFLSPKTIPDPESSKPKDWDDNPKIDDPDASQPEVREPLCVCACMGEGVWKELRGPCPLS